MRMALTRDGATGVLDVQDPAWDHLDVLFEVLTFLSAQLAESDKDHNTALPV
jgi:hypothetical protein